VTSTGRSRLMIESLCNFYLPPKKYLALSNYWETASRSESERHLRNRCPAPRGRLRRLAMDFRLQAPTS
jgi:hypothetical protein